MQSTDSRGLFLTLLSSVAAIAFGTVLSAIALYHLQRDLIDA